MFSNLKKRKKSFIAVFLPMLALSIIFLNSFYWPHEGIGERKMLAVAIAIFLAVVLPVVLVNYDFFYRFVERLMENGSKFILSIKKNRKKVFIFIGLAILGMAISYFGTVLMSDKVFNTEFNRYLMYMFLAIFGIIICVGFMWKNAAQKPENIFLAVALILGVFIIGVTPNRVGVSWDDEIHYERALELSNVLNGIMYEADEMNIKEYVENINSHSCFDRTSNQVYMDKLELSYSNKKLVPHDFTYYRFSSVSSIPSAIGIIIARGLNMSYEGVFNMGRFFNLLIYAILIFCAIKRVKYGKILVAVIGLIPTTVFMAANYSYDSWVTGFTILGFSYFIAELQENSKIKYKNMIIMIGAIALGCMPKAIYFPIFFPLLFMPKRKFNSSKQRKIYYMLVIGAGIFLVSTFALPLLIGGAGTGDARGGAEVNASEQINFIINNPWKFMKILTNFEMYYMSMPSAGAMLQKFAYVGDGVGYGLVSIILALLAFLDRGEYEDNNSRVKVATLIANLGSIILATTALYIDFTAVALDTVSGMQGRYIIPTIYPALYALGFAGTKHKINKNFFSCVPMLIIAMTVVYNMYKLCVVCF